MLHRLHGFPHHNFPRVMNATEALARLITQHQYAQAIALLENQSRDPVLRNLLGVCYLRTGQVRQAVEL